MTTLTSKRDTASRTPPSTPAHKRYPRRARTGPTEWWRSCCWQILRAASAAPGCSMLLLPVPAAAIRLHHVLLSLPVDCILSAFAC
jgi:hypothetical protein